MKLCKREMTEMVRCEGGIDNFFFHQRSHFVRFCQYRLYTGVAECQGADSGEAGREDRWEAFFVVSIMITACVGHRAVSGVFLIPVS